MRPIYETNKDLSNEGKVKKVVESKWGIKLEKLDRRQKIDFVMTRGKEIKGWVEVKCRNYDWEQIDRFGGYMVSLQKWISGRTLSSITDKPFFLVVSCKGDVRYLNCNTDNVTFEIGGRRDRNDAMDIEPVAIVPVSEFVKVENDPS